MTSLEITGLLAIILMYTFAVVGIIVVLLLVERGERLMKLGKDGVSDGKKQSAWNSPLRQLKN